MAWLLFRLIFIFLILSPPTVSVMRMHHLLNNGPRTAWRILQPHYERNGCCMSIEAGDESVDCSHRVSQRKLRLVTAPSLNVYRGAAPSLVGPTDCVLEIGCQLAEFTALLASRASRVIGIDVDRKLAKNGLQRTTSHRKHETAAAAGLPNNTMLHICDPRDFLSIQRICSADEDSNPVTVLLLDVGVVIGHDLPLDGLALCRQLSRCFPHSLHTILVRSKLLDQLQRTLLLGTQVAAPAEILPMEDSSSRIVATIGVAEYRSAAKRMLQPGWNVLEIGCHFGTSTNIIHTIASHTGGSCMGVDVSSRIIKQAKIKHPEVIFEVCDAWDVAGLQNAWNLHCDCNNAHSACHARTGPDMILLDVGGMSSSHGELDTLALLRTLTSAFPSLQVVIVKSRNLYELASQLQSGYDIARARGVTY